MHYLALFFILFLSYATQAFNPKANRGVQSATAKRGAWHKKGPQPAKQGVSIDRIGGQVSPSVRVPPSGQVSPSVRVPPSGQIPPPASGLNNIRMILSLPLENRIQALSHYGPGAFGLLEALLVSKKESMPVRWKALTSLARLYPHKSLPLVHRALRSPPWFLQNAGLIAMEIIDPQQAVTWADYFLNAPSLVVRTAAVDMIKKHGARQYKARLLDKLNAPDSFYKKKSLWIRSHIVSALSALSKPGEEPLFISFLQDPDERLHIHAILALEKLTGKTFRPSEQGGNLLAQAQKHKWMDWWAKSGYDSNIKL